DLSVTAGRWTCRSFKRPKFRAEFFSVGWSEATIATEVEATSILPSLHGKTARSWRGILPFTHPCYDLDKLVAGVTKQGLDLHSHSAKRVCLQYDKSRRQHKRPWLRWRSRRSLGWVPFSTGHVAHRDGGFVFRGERYEVWLHRPLPEGARIGAGSFSQDTRGRWYINCPVEVSEGVCLPGSWHGLVGSALTSASRT